MRYVIAHSEQRRRKILPGSKACVRCTLLTCGIVQRGTTYGPLYATSPVATLNEGTVSLAPRRKSTRHPCRSPTRHDTLPEGVLLMIQAVPRFYLVCQALGGRAQTLDLEPTVFGRWARVRRGLVQVAYNVMNRTPESISCVHPATNERNTRYVESS